MNLKWVLKSKKIKRKGVVHKRKNKKKKDYTGK